MTNLNNSYKIKSVDFIFALLLLMLSVILVSCSSATEKSSGTKRPSGAVAAAESDFDPLHDPRDREVFESEKPQTTEIKPGTREDDFNWAKVDSFLQAQNLEDSTLTLYRVQLFASQYFTEANYELQMAQDVFTDPVFLKYDLPYYKVLLGNTTESNRGRRLLNKARSLGYYNSWLIESPPDSIYYRMLYVQDSLSALDSIPPAETDQPQEEPEE